MNQKYPIKAFDGTNTADVSVLNLPAGSVGANGEIDLGVGVKVYRALLTQTGTDAPVATVLKNTLGETVVWTRGLAGVYFGTLAGAFLSGKTYISPFQYVDPSNGAYQLYRYTDNAVTIESLTGVDLSDSLFAAYFPVPIEILVYP